MKNILGVFAVTLSFIAYFPYFKDILKKKTIPHPYSWFIWGFSSSLIASLQITHGAGAGAWATVAVVLICFMIGILSLRNGAAKNITKIDTMLFIVAIIAAILWLFVKQPVLSIILLVGSDVIGFIPSVRKSWNKPRSETLSMWVITGFVHFVNLLALSSYQFVAVLNPVVWMLADFAFAGMLIFRRRAYKK